MWSLFAMVMSVIFAKSYNKSQKQSHQTTARLFKIASPLHWVFKKLDKESIHIPDEEKLITVIRKSFHVQKIEEKQPEQTQPINTQPVQQGGKYISEGPDY